MERKLTTPDQECAKRVEVDASLLPPGAAECTGGSMEERSLEDIANLLGSGT